MGKASAASPPGISTSRFPTARVAYLLDDERVVRFEFGLSNALAKHPARLRIHTADQAEKTSTQIVVTVNGRRMEETLPRDLGLQRTDPPHLAFAATAEFQALATDLRPGQNLVEIRVEGEGWFTWDAMDLARD